LAALALSPALRHYNEGEARMEIVTLERLPIVVGREDDGRWWADIESMPGVMAYGATRESAIAAVRALALRVAADCIDHGENVPEPVAMYDGSSFRAGRVL
jgi:predicted RNase H-like HicB family nuclease